MRTITKTHTGAIITDTDLGLEYLYVGDYGKENNIKADFLGYTKRIEKVEHKPIDLTEKLVVTVSSQKGCPMNCQFCDCPKVGFHGNATLWELMSEINTALALSGVKEGKRLNLHFARMGEPTFNWDVIEAAMRTWQIIKDMFREYHPVVSTMMPKNNEKLLRFLQGWVAASYISEPPFEYGGDMGLQLSINTLNEKDRERMFGGMSLSLKEISDMMEKVPLYHNLSRRKFTLNFAVTPESDLDPKKMDQLFDKDKFIVKITPIHATHEALKNGYEIVSDYSVYERFEQPLVEAGWDVIVFVPSAEEDADRITCGNALLSSIEEGNDG